MALVQKQFGELITFTRSSAAGRFNASGVFEMVPANQPRFDYDPATKVLRGMLIEEARTNLILQSSDFSHSSWGKNTSNISITPNAAISPDGGLNASTVNDTGTGDDYMAQSVAFNSLLRYSTSVHVRKTTDSLSTVGIWLFCSGGTSAQSSIGVLNTNTGTVISGGGALVESVSYGDYWRLQVTTPADNGTGNSQIQIRIYPVFNLITDNNANRRNDLTGSSVMWGCQVESGQFATSYIPTTTSQVTRAADAPFVNQLSPWYNPVEGTLYVDYTPGYIGVGSTNAGVYMSSAAAADNVVTLRDGPLKGTIYGLIALRAGSTESSLIGATGVPVGTNLRAAMSFRADGVSFSVNGGKAVTRGPITMPIPTRMGVGTAPNAQQSSNGYVRAVRYYPRRMTDAELQALTT